MSKTPRTKVLGVLPWDMDTPCGREGSEGAKSSQGSEGVVGCSIYEGACASGAEGAYVIHRAFGPRRQGLCSLRSGGKGLGRRL